MPIPGLKAPYIYDRSPFVKKFLSIREDDGWIDQALKKAIPAYGKGVTRMVLDGTYYMVPEDKFAAIVTWDWSDKRRYVAERFDCEDFGFAFKSHVNEFWLLNQVGLVLDYSAGHGYNVVIFPSGRVWIFEPQNHQIVQPGRAPYTLKDAVIVL